MSSWASTPRLTGSTVETDRGFVPSDVATDPRKKEFLTDLSRKIFSPTAKSKSLFQLHKRLNMVRNINRPEAEDLLIFCILSCFDSVLPTVAYYPFPLLTPFKSLIRSSWFRFLLWESLNWVTETSGWKLYQKHSWNLVNTKGKPAAVRCLSSRKKLLCFVI